MGIPVFLWEMGAGQFSSEGPIKIWNICPLFQGEMKIKYNILKCTLPNVGIGYGMLMLSLYIGIYYNILISWSFFYLFSSFTSSLPWATCDNDWNTAACSREQEQEQPRNNSGGASTATNLTNPSDEFFQ